MVTKPVRTPTPSFMSSCSKVPVQEEPIRIRCDYVISTDHNYSEWLNLPVNAALHAQVQTSTPKCKPEQEHPGETVQLSTVLFMHKITRAIVGLPGRASHN